MNQTRPGKALREDASRWWARLDSGPVSESDRKAFEAWRGQSPEHAAAFAEICALWGELDALRGRFSSPVTGIPPGQDRVAAASRRAWPIARRRGRTGARWAAVVALLFACIALPALLAQPDYCSAVGEIRTVRLEDGSTVYLSSDSALNVDFGPQQRSLELLKGEAWFEVAHDPTRPFVVQAGKGTATALGTVYDVKTVGHSVQVAVIASRVAVAYGERGSPHPGIVLGAGQQTAYSDASPPSAVTAVDPDTVSAWRRGRLVFENQPLAEVIAELNRYHRGLIVLTDESLQRRAVSGVFRTDDPGYALAALENSLGLKTTRITDYLILLHR